MFSTLAWLKWQYLCHAGPTEVAGFGLSSSQNPLYLEDVLVIRQRATPVTVGFDDHAVADLFDEMADAGISPSRFARIWLHTHPGSSVTPSGTDEDTFQRCFGGCDWAVMAILGRTGRTYARLRFNAGPGTSVIIPTAVDWADWHDLACNEELSFRIDDWRREYSSLVEADEFRWGGESFATGSSSPTSSGFPTSTSPSPSSALALANPPVLPCPDFRSEAGFPDFAPFGLFDSTYPGGFHDCD